MLGRDVCPFEIFRACGSVATFWEVVLEFSEMFDLILCRLEEMKVVMLS